jgi:hypothetical protein
MAATDLVATRPPADTELTPEDVAAWATNCAQAAEVGQQWYDEFIGLLTTPLRKLVMDLGFGEMPNAMMIVKYELGDTIPKMIGATEPDYDEIKKEYDQAHAAMGVVVRSTTAFFESIGSPTPERLMRLPGGAKFLEILQGTQQLQIWVNDLGRMIEVVFNNGEPPPPPPPPGEPDPAIWNTAIPDDLPHHANEGTHGMTWGQDSWYPGKTEPFFLPPGQPQLNGIWHRFMGTTSWGESGTLWHINAYNVYGEIDGLELWGIGDFDKGREGHGLYLRCVPHLDTTIRNYKCYKNGGQAIQREWRTTETDIPRSVWENAGGTFLVEDCDFQENGLIDEGTGGSAVRASWAMALYSTMQTTIVRRVTHINYFSPAPHEGSLFVGFGQAAWRTPLLLVEDCDFYTLSGDRADIMLQGVDDATIQRTYIRGPNPVIDVVDNCKNVLITDMPQDVTVRIKQASNPHGYSTNVQQVAAGATLALDF